MLAGCPPKKRDGGHEGPHQSEGLGLLIHLNCTENGFFRAVSGHQKVDNGRQGSCIHAERGFTRAQFPLVNSADDAALEVQHLYRYLLVYRMGEYDGNGALHGVGEYLQLPSEQIAIFHPDEGLCAENHDVQIANGNEGIAIQRFGSGKMAAEKSAITVGGASQQFQTGWEGVGSGSAGIVMAKEASIAAGRGRNAESGEGKAVGEIARDMDIIIEIGDRIRPAAAIHTP